jgi:hypothetical protein
MCRARPDCQGKPDRFIASAMNDVEKKARLAEALRANLRRRKAQVRETADDSRAEPAGRESPKPD